MFVWIVIIFLVVVILTLVGHAIWLIVALVFRSLFGTASNENSATQNLQNQQPRYEHRIVETCRTLNELLDSEVLSQDQFHTVRDAIERRYADLLDLPARLILPAAPASADVTEPGPTKTTPPVVSPGSLDADSDVVVADVVRTADRSMAPAVPDRRPPVVDSETPIGDVAPAAPWDIPNDPPQPPRKKLSDIMAGFMQEKNIRWGELASGILIVGSAVGLVISLRQELQRTIPYFPALLFMLLTVAVHAAGIYTLRRWKLRNTSRGVLVIGLLLVPLNFLAACLLTGTGEAKRELSDPVFWIAIITGIAVFSAITWVTTRSLTRRGHLPLFTGVICCAVAPLVINRVETFGVQSWTTILATLLPVAGFAIVTTTISKRQWVHERWSSRSVNRFLLFLGIATFSYLVGISLIPVQSPAGYRINVIAAITPSVVVVCLIGAWIGLLIQRGVVGKQAASQRIIGLSIAILGGALAVLAIAFSFANSTILMFNAVVAAAIAGLIGWRERLSIATACAGFCSALAIVVAIQHGLGVFRWDRITGASEYLSGFVSGTTGITLMTTAIIGLMVNRFFFVRNGEREELLFSTWNRNTAIGIGGIGCGLALIASFVNRDNAFDVTTATVLLGIAAIVAHVLCVTRKKQVFVHLAAVLTLGFVAHGLFWNQSIGDWMIAQMQASDYRWIAGACIAAIATAVTAAVIRNGQKDSDLNVELSRLPESDLTLLILSLWSAAFVIATAIGGLIVTANFDLAGPLILMAVVLVSLVLGWSSRTRVASSGIFVAICLAAGSAISIATHQTGYWISWLGFQHVVIQVTLLSACCGLWTFGTACFGRQRQVKWLFDRDEIRADQILAAIVATILILVVFAGLIPGVVSEVSAASNFDFESFPKLDSSLSLLYVAIAVAGICLLIKTIVRPNLAFGVLIFLLGLSSLCSVGIHFQESRSVASALRWLIAVGGIGTAILLGICRQFTPGWIQLRRTLGLRGRSTFSLRDMQLFVGSVLTVVIVGVLGLSTMVIVKAMYDGPDSLGGPLAESLLGQLRKDVSFGVPVAMIVATLLFFAISERRKLYAICGSAVFQYFVLLAIFLLVTSPHPQLASTWFITILQAVSIGMTTYAACWYFFRPRIENLPADSGKFSRQLDLHVGLNCLLLLCLASTAAFRFWIAPAETGGWLSAVGSPLGIISLVVLLAMNVVIWPSSARQHLNWTIAIGAFTGSSLIAAASDRYLGEFNWIPFRIIEVGVIASAVAMLVTTLIRSKTNGFVLRPVTDEVRKSVMVQLSWPLAITGFMMLLFGVRGALADPTADWVSFLTLVLLGGVIFWFGIVTWRWEAGIGATLVAMLTVVAYCYRYGGDGRLIDLVNLCALTAGLIALVWLAIRYLAIYKNTAPTSAAVGVFPNIVAVGLTLLVGLQAGFDFFSQTIFSEPRLLSDSNLGIGLVLFTGFFHAFSLWHVHGVLRVTHLLLWLLSSAFIFGAGLMPEFPDLLIVSLAIICLLFSLWGAAWYLRRDVRSLGARLGIPRLGSIRAESIVATSILVGITGALVLISGLFSTLTTDGRALRYLAAFSPAGLAVAMAAYSDGNRRRWLQLCCLAFIAVSGVLVSLSDLSPNDVFDSLQLMVRILVVFALATFIFGGIVPRMARHSDLWLMSIREATVVSCGLLIASLVILVSIEAQRFAPETGSGLATGASVAVSFIIALCVFGLVSIAVLPKHDPMSLPLTYRKAYVYVAQFVLVLFGAHLYLSMPGLFQFGLRQFWPYVAMAVSFGALAFSRLLEKRQLDVLSVPIMHSAIALPLVTVAGLWSVQSKAEPSIVMLTAGLIYLTISLQSRSFVAGALSIVFGNAALWLYYGKIPQLDFLTHPQVWLIPPAISVLVAVQFYRSKLTSAQLATIRYVAVSVIYVSSTSEIFISGLGSATWPPIILAMLAIAGMGFGILLQIRAYLYLGSLFLLMSMISMVAHAHQRLDHVWPWWAFGITLGTAILVMFGFFEKKRKELKSIAQQLGQWDY